MEERLLIATLEEIKIHGLKFTMDDLTKRLHISKSSLYKTITSKNILINKLVTYIIANYEYKERQLLKSNLDVYNKIQNLIALYIDIFNQFNNNIYHDLQINYYDEWLRWQKFQEQRIGILIKLVEEGITANKFRQVNLAVLKQCMLYTAPALCDYNFLQENNLSYSDAVKHYVDILLFGIEKEH